MCDHYLHFLNLQSKGQVVTDIVDKANELSERLISAEIAEIRKRQADSDKAYAESRMIKNGLETVKCIECGEAISEGRLLAMPYAVRCLSCQQEYENG